MTSQKCTHVVFTAKAFRDMVAETFEHPHTETGGIFLGKIVAGTWYVLETIDPGPNAILRSAYFEYDQPYVNHLANKTARYYVNGLELLGLWHRHPGSLDTFSSTDNMTNCRYAQMLNGGAISGIVNLDPTFRFTLYHIALPLTYAATNFTIDDERVLPDLMVQKKIMDFMPERQWMIEPGKAGTSQKVNQSRTTRQSSKNRARETQGRFIPVTPRNDELQQLLLDMWDAEVDYLESQIDYDFRTVMKPAGLAITLKYVGQMAEYPIFLEFLFSVTPDGNKIVKINGESSPYIEGSIKNTINRAVSQRTNQ